MFSKRRWLICLLSFHKGSCGQQRVVGANEMGFHPFGIIRLKEISGGPVRRPLPFVRARGSTYKAQSPRWTPLWQSRPEVTQGAWRLHVSCKWSLVCTSCSHPADPPPLTPIVFHLVLSWELAPSDVDTTALFLKKWPFGEECSFSEANTLFLLPVQGEGGRFALRSWL